MTTETERHDDVFSARIGLGLRELDGLEPTPDVRDDVARRLQHGDVGDTGGARNPRRLLPAMVALLALAVTATLVWQARDNDDNAAAQDPDHRRVVYQVAADATERATEAACSATLASLRERLHGVAAVELRGGSMFTVTVADAGDLPRARSLVEAGDTFEVRLMARDDYRADDAPDEPVFDMDAEREHLVAWLEDGGYDRLREDPQAIRDHRAISPYLRWYPRLVRPDGNRPGLWQHTFAKQREGIVEGFTARDWNDGTVPPHLLALAPERQFLVELFAVNVHAHVASAKDIDPGTVRKERDQGGRDAIVYAMREPAATRYAHLTATNIGRMFPMLWRGEVLSAPIIQGRIPGRGMIAGLDAATTDTLVTALTTPTELPLEFVRTEPAPN